MYRYSRGNQQIQTEKNIELREREKDSIYLVINICSFSLLITIDILLGTQIIGK